MTKHAQLARSALPAIAAALALGSTPLLAQDIQTPPPVSAGPVVTASQSPPPIATIAPAANQVIVPPPIVQSVTTTTIPQQPTEVESNPVVQQVSPAPVIDATTAPATRTAPPVAAQSSRPASKAPIAVTNRASQTATAVSEPVPAPLAEDTSTNAQPSATQPPLASVDAPLGAEPVIEPTDSSIGLPAEYQLIAVLAALGLIIGGVAMFRRRRHGGSLAIAPVVERPLVEPVKTVVLAPTPSVTPREDSVEPLLATRQITVDRPTARVQRIVEPTQAGTLAHAGAAVALPREVPESFEERDALLQRMIAARPDRANPFRTPRTRMKRARLILQSLGRTFDREPGIDLSQYPNNWPELARRDYPQVA